MKKRNASLLVAAGIIAAVAWLAWGAVTPQPNPRQAAEPFLGVLCGDWGSWPDSRGEAATNSLYLYQASLWGDSPSNESRDTYASQLRAACRENPASTLAMASLAAYGSSEP